MNGRAALMGSIRGLIDVGLGSLMQGGLAGLGSVTGSLDVILPQPDAGE